MVEALRVLITVAGLQSEHGGPSRSVPALAESLTRVGVEVELITCGGAVGDRPPLLPPPDRVISHVLPNHCRQPSAWLKPKHPFTAMLCERSFGRHSVVIHDHGLWLPTNHAAARAARGLRRPFMISPRGMLSGWALQYRGLKKRIAWYLYQRRDLKWARLLHATSRPEAEEFRRLGFRQPIAVVPNGVETPPKVAPKAGQSKTGSRTVLFLGRIHPVKGLLDLVHAWAALRPVGWRVIIAGSEDPAHRQQLDAAIRDLRLNSAFSFTGRVEGETKWELYRQADLFVLPSYSENFGIVVAEALSCGVPVITTRGTPWGNLLAHRCGWWTEIGSEPLAAALQEACSLSDGVRCEMGTRGRELVERNHSWRAVAQQMASVYQWMLEEGERPDSVRTIE